MVGCCSFCCRHPVVVVVQCRRHATKLPVTEVKSWREVPHDKRDAQEEAQREPPHNKQFRNSRGDDFEQNERSKDDTQRESKRGRSEKQQ